MGWRGVAAGLAAGIWTIAGAAAAQEAAQAAPAQTDWAVAGLTQPAEIRVDRWGIAHIYAASPRDAFFLQGYNVARDRLWQIDLWRKRGLGLLAHDFGPSFVAQDRAARLFLYRGDMAAEWAAYGDQSKSQAEAFTAGINAYVAEVRDGRRPLPVEFATAGTTPDLWAPEDVVRIRSHGLTRNAGAEAERARIACAAGLPAARLMKKLEPAVTPQVPDGLNPCDVPAAVLADYRLAGQGVRLAAEPGARATLERYDVPPEGIGSNNWTIAPSRTATGRPLLANDPHREHGAPSLRYIVHLEAPGLSVIGAGEPALPGVSIGHNDVIAFGLTIFAADQEDLYVYELSPTDPDLYRYGSGWERMKTVVETVAVKGEAPRQVTMKFTRHGPVTLVDAGRRRAFAVRTVWNEPGTAAYFGSSRYMTARNWGEFTAAMDGWGAPSENQVYADVQGHIGWIAAGRTPVRRNWDGLMPVPGDGRYEWDGFMKAAELPQTFDPAKGWVATANEMNLPADFPADRKVGYEWSSPSRVQRIDEVIAAKPKFTVADGMALQTDPTDVTSRRTRALLANLDAADPEVRAALALLRDWDGTLAPDSAAAALHEIWVTKHLGPATVARAAPAPARALLGAGDRPAILDYLDSAEAAPVRATILVESLKAAFDEVKAKLGPDPAAWRWGDLHQARFEHLLSPRVPAAERGRWAAGPLPMPGGSGSPLAATWRPNDYRVIAGASFRMVLDVGSWDDSRVINTPGQSGEPGSPHFSDLFAKWAAGEYVPLAYSRPAVEAATESVLRLTPR